MRGIVGRRRGDGDEDKRALKKAERKADQEFVMEACGLVLVFKVEEDVKNEVTILLSHKKE